MPKYQGDTVDEAVASGLKDLALTKEQVTIKILNEGKKGFLGIGKQAAEVELSPIETAVVEVETVSEVEVPKSEEVVEKISATVSDSEVNGVLEDLDDEEALKELALYLTNITRELNAPALVKIDRDNTILVFHLETTKQGILIGKHGKVLNALQYLAQVFIHRVAKNKLSVVVNVGDYREKRQAILERLANKTAERVKRTGQPVFLEPMPAFERKQVHAALTKNPYVKTHSEGEEPYRYLVVEPEKNVF